MEKAINVHKAQFEELPLSAGTGAAHNLNMLMDVPVPIVVELGRKSLKIKEILSLDEGAVIALEREEGEPLDILMNGRPIARGEVVIVDNNLGVRVVEILDAGNGGKAEVAGATAEGEVA